MITMKYYNFLPGYENNFVCGETNKTDCENGGTCTTSTVGQTLCQCPIGYRGIRCEQRLSQCPDFSVLKNDLYHNTEQYDGSITTWLCGAGMIPSVSHSVCQTDQWSPSPVCYKVPPTTTTSTTSTTSRTYYYSSSAPPFSLKKFLKQNSWLTPLLIIFICLEQIFAPFLVYWCIKKYRKYDAKASKSDHKAASDVKILKKELSLTEQTLQNEEAIKKLSDIEQRLTKAVDGARAKRRRQQHVQNKSPSLFRVTSCFYYWSSLSWIIYLIISSHLNLSDYNSLFSTVDILGYVFMPIMMVVVLIESFVCSEFQYIRNLSLVSSAAERIEEIRMGQPSVVMSAVCYHYETRTRTVYYQDSNGNTQSRLETYQEKVITANITQPYFFSFWQDQSPKTLMDIDRQKVTKIRMRLYVLFGDADTASDFYDRYSRFQDENRHRDTFVDFGVDRNAAGFEKRLAAYTDVKKKPFWIALRWYVIFAFLYFGWIYRIVFNHSTGRTEYKVVKLIYLNRPSDVNMNVQNVCDADKLIDSKSDESEVPPPTYDSLISVIKNNITSLMKELEQFANNDVIVDNDDNDDETSLGLVTDTKFMHVVLGEKSELHQIV